MLAQIGPACQSVTAPRCGDRACGIVDSVVRQAKREHLLGSCDQNGDVNLVEYECIKLRQRNAEGKQSMHTESPSCSPLMSFVGTVVP